MDSAKTGGNCLIILKTNIFLRDEMGNFQNYTLPKTVVLSLLKLVRHGEKF